MAIWKILVLTCLFFAPSVALAQATLTGDTVMIEKAQVISIDKQGTSTIAGTDAEAQIQTITAKVLSGVEAGKAVKFDNDYIQLSVGQVFYLRHSANSLDGSDYYSVSDPYRLPILGALFVIFLLILFAFGGLPGIRGLLSLAGSIALIFIALFPAMLHGYSPTLVGIAVAGTIIIAGSYITHGFNRTTSAAVIGMLLTLFITGVGAYLAVTLAHLSGYTNEETASLNIAMQGKLDTVGLLFAGIMIGLLGVLYDIAIGQAIAIEELFKAGSHLSRQKIYRRGIRIGREHIGALINTLAIAYVGVALPLLLLVQSSTYDLPYMLNSEIFATEIIRILIGSIGLILAVPITTAIAAYSLPGTPLARNPK
jgi:uncharacterized membrane protein